MNLTKCEMDKAHFVFKPLKWLENLDILDKAKYFELNL